MKRSLPATLAIAAGLAGAAPPPAAAEIRVFACEPEWAALAEEIGGEDVDVWSATGGRQDPHFVRARPSLIARVRRADLLFCSGADLEAGWLPILMQRGATAAIQPGQPGHMIAADHVEALDCPETLDRSLGDVHPGGNPHFHLDPRNIESLAIELTVRLETVDPDNADGYRARLASFRGRWAEASSAWRARAARLAGLPVVVHHEAWLYFLRWAGLERAAALERLPGVPPTAGHLERALGEAIAAGARAIIRAPFEPDHASDWFSERTGIPVVELPYTVGGQEGVDNLFDLFDATLSLLEETARQH